MGRLYMATGRPKAAQSQLQAALSADPQSIPVHIELARLFHHEGQFSDALTHYEAILQIDDSLAETRFWHAALLVLSQRHAEAISELDAAIDVWPQDPNPKLLLARILVASPDSTLRDTGRAEELLAQSGDSIDVFFAETAAMVAAQTGHFERARQWQGKAVQALEGMRPRSALHTARRRLVLYQRNEACRAPWEARETRISEQIDHTGIHWPTELRKE
jgi:tetratricopeptide (TPR) repeat protein